MHTAPCVLTSMIAQGSSVAITREFVTGSVMRGSRDTDDPMTEVQNEHHSRSRHLSKVVILSMPRTGSTMVTAQLSSHPKIRIFSAIFSPPGWTSRHLEGLKHGLSPEWDDVTFRIANRRILMDRLFALAGAEDCFGFKHHINSVPEVCEAVIERPDIGKILLNRDNVLACYASHLKARAVGRVKAGREAKPRKMKFHVERFERYMEVRKAAYGTWADRVVAGLGPSIRMEYNEARTREGMQRLVHFIGLDPSDISQAGTKKRGSDNIAARFENAEDVEKYLRAKGLEEWGTEEIHDECSEHDALDV